MESLIFSLVVIALYRLVIWASGGQVVYSKTTTVAQNVTMGIFIGLAILSGIWLILRLGW